MLVISAAAANGRTDIVAALQQTAMMIQVLWAQQWRA